MTTEHLIQSQAFLAWYRKMTRTPWDEAFVAWTESKAFAPEDRRIIRRLVHTALLSTGEAVSTDCLTDWTDAA